MAQCRSSLSESKKVILTAQFRSQLPIINIASLCNEKRKSLINIELSGWDEENRVPHSYSSF
ncbi:Unknow protein (fragment) [Vibrio coralliirubri]